VPESSSARTARLLLTGVSVDAFGTGLTLPFLVVYLHSARGIPLETVGLIVAVPALVALVALGPIGVLIDRVGPRRVQIAALVAAATGPLLLSWTETAALAFVARVFSGIGGAAFWPANQALIASVVPSEQQQRYFGVSFALMNAGIGVGGIVGGTFVDVARPETFAVVYRVDAITFLVPLVLLAFVLRDIGGPATGGHADAVDAARGYGEVLRDRVFRRLLVVGFVSAFVGYGQVEGGWTAYANVIARVSARTIGYAFAVNTAVIVLLQLVVLRWIAGRRRTRMLMLQAALWAASWTMLGTAGLAPATPFAAALCVSAFGVFAVGETLMSPIGPALVNDVAPERLRGRYNAASGIPFNVAAIIAPAVAGGLLGAGRGDAFIAMVVAGCGVLALAILRLERVLPARANGLADGTATSARGPSGEAGSPERLAR
jgi:MFS family permease